MSICGIRYILFVVPGLICNPGSMILVVFDICCTVYAIYIWFYMYEIQYTDILYNMLYIYIYIHIHDLWFVCLYSIWSWNTSLLRNLQFHAGAWSKGSLGRTRGNDMPHATYTVLKQLGSLSPETATFDDSSRFGTWILGKFYPQIGGFVEFGPSS